MLGLPGRKSHKDLVVISIGIGAIPMGLDSFGHGVDQPIHLAATTHIVQHRISLAAGW
jgi:hypothetical protein